MDLQLKCRTGVQIVSYSEKIVLLQHFRNYLFLDEEPNEFCINLKSEYLILRNSSGGAIIGPEDCILKKLSQIKASLLFATFF